MQSVLLVVSEHNSYREENARGSYPSGVTTTSLHKDHHDAEGAVAGGHGRVHGVLGVAGLVLVDDGVGLGSRTDRYRAGSTAEGSMGTAAPSLVRARH